MDRINFNLLFRLNDEGSIEPLHNIRIGGVQMGPGVKVGRGVLFGGIDLFNFVGRDFQTRQESGVTIIDGVYG
jgi:hypothetical protein